MKQTLAQRAREIVEQYDFDSVNDVHVKPLVDRISQALADVREADAKAARQFLEKKMPWLLDDVAQELADAIRRQEG